MDSLERFARIRAAIEQGGDRGRVLRDEGLTPAEWIQLQRRWLDALAAEIASGGDTLATRYCEAFEAAQSAARPGEHAGAAEETATPPVTTADAPKPENAGHDGESLPMPPGPAGVHVPSYLKAPSTPLPIATLPQPSTDLRGTALAFEVPRMPAMPFKQGSPAPSIASSPAPKASPPVHSGTVLTLDVPRDPSPATPFRSEPQATGRPDVAVGASTEFAASSSAGPATPFQALEPEALGFNLTRHADLVAARSEPGTDLATVLAEFEIDADAHARIEDFWRRKFAENGLLALDFGRLITQAKKARHDRRAPRPAAPFGTGTALALDVPKGSSTAMPFRSDADATGGSPGSGTESAPSPRAGPATPFVAPEPEAMGFNLMRYSDLVAARSEPGADMAAVLAEFEIDADAHARIEAYWSRKFAETGLLALEFGRLLTQAKKARTDRRAPRPAAPFGTGTALALDVPRSAMPFATAGQEPAPPPPIPELSVDQYAWIVASLRKTTDVPATLARFRLTPETRKELEARWAQRMAAAPALRETFLAALGRYLAGGTG